VKGPAGKKIGSILGWGLLIVALLAVIDYRITLGLLANLDSVEESGQALKTVSTLLGALDKLDAGTGGTAVVTVHRQFQDLRQWAAGNPERQAWLKAIEQQATLAGERKPLTEDIRKLAGNIALEHQKARRAAQEMIVAVVGFGGLAVFALVLLAGTSVTERLKAQRELHRISGWLLQAEDRERRRIARELHDTTGQNLAALEISLSLVSESESRLEPKARQALSDAIGLARVCSREIRSLSYLLHPPVLEEEGLAAALRASAEGYAQRAGLQIRLDIPTELGRMPVEIELALLHFMQECLLNVYQHARSNTAEVRIALTATEVLAAVSDRGHGELTRKGEAKLGVGIAGMRERARQLGGRVEIDSGDPEPR